MIAYLKGKLTHKDPAYVIIEANGIGYRVKISLNTYSKLGKAEDIKLHTYFMVKEDSQELYGFSEIAEHDLFVKLISISGVGGNTAMTILSSISPKELRHAIDTENIGQLKAVKGIGPKTAGRIILELKGKLKTDSGDGDDSSPANAMREEALRALTSLGFPKSSIEKRVDQLMKENPDAKLEELIKLALRG